MLPEEITHPSAEYTSTDGAEFSPLPDEFFQRAVPADTPKKKRKPIQLAAGVIAAVVVVNAFMGLPPARSNTPTESPVESTPIVEATEPVTEVTEPIVETTTTPPTEPPFEMEVLDSYQNPSDTCIITVYADYFDVAQMGIPVLMEQTVQESTFTELALPEAPDYEGYSVLGYVITYRSADTNGDAKSVAVDVGFSLTLDEVQLVPVRDGVRRVSVHPIWVADAGVTNWEYAPVVTLDSGDEIVSIPIDLPLASGGSFYVCAIVPEREGYTFAGWYNEEGQRVYSLFAEDLFTQTGEDGYIDWTKPTNVTLTAKWIRNP